MARVTVPFATLEAGQFPPICCRTGEHTTTYERWRFGSDLTGILPMTAAARSRVRVLRGLAGLLLLVAGALLMGSIAASATDTLGPPRAWALGALAAGVVAALSMIAATLASPGAKRSDDSVVLKRIDERFAAAIIAARGSTDAPPHSSA